MKTVPRIAALLVLAVAGFIACDGPSTRLEAGRGLTPPPDMAWPRCEWSPPDTGVTEVARSATELLALVRRAQPGTTILIEDGEYMLPASIGVQVPHVTLRGRSGNADTVMLRGSGMNERSVGVALSIGASHVTVADLSVGHVGYHGVQVHGELGVEDVTLHNVHVIDTGQQLVKGSAGNGRYADNVLVQCSTFEYSNHAPGTYTNGVDVLGGRGWIVRDNRFIRIRGPEAERWNAGPAILFWANAQDTLVERNLIVDSSRGIAFGLGPGASEYTRGGGRIDHTRGAIRNNVLVNLNSWADEGVEANAAVEFGIDHNTVLVTGRLPWSISVRFPESDGKVRNNLTARQIILRDDAKAGMRGNVHEGRLDWFVNAAENDFRLTRFGAPALDAGTALPDIPDDFYRWPRTAGAQPDAGAVEMPEGK